MNGSNVEAISTGLGQKSECEVKLKLGHNTATREHVLEVTFFLILLHDNTILHLHTIWWRSTGSMDNSSRILEINISAAVGSNFDRRITLAGIFGGHADRPM